MEMHKKKIYAGLVEIFQKTVQQTKEAIYFVKIKLKAKLAILGFFFESKMPLTAKTMLKLGDYVKKKTKILKPDVMDISAIIFYCGELLSMIFASGLLYAIVFFFLFVLVMLVFAPLSRNPDVHLGIVVIYVTLFFAYFVCLQSYWVYRILKYLNQTDRVGYNPETEFDFELLKNELKTTKKIFFFFLKKWFADLSCFVYYFVLAVIFFGIFLRLVEPCLNLLIEYPFFLEAYPYLGHVGDF